MVEKAIVALVLAMLAAMLLFALGLGVYVITVETIYCEEDKPALITAIAAVVMTIAIAAVVYFRP